MKTRLLREEILEILRVRDGWVCFHPHCQLEFTEEDEVTIDHWLPLSAGGTWDVENLRLMHRVCNAHKSDTIPNGDELPAKERRNQHKIVQRPTICTTCNSGRKIYPGGECEDCGSGPQPPKTPRTLTVHPKECDHDVYTCFMCHVMEPGLRVSSSDRILNG